MKINTNCATFAGSRQCEVKSTGKTTKDIRTRKSLKKTAFFCRACIATNEMRASCASMNNNEQYHCDSAKKFL